MPLTDQMASPARRASRRQPGQAIVHNRATKADILRMLRKDTCLHVSMAEASSSAEVAGVPWLRRFRIVVRIADAHL